jgi:single-stranded-DNA-specific exonuclease
MFFNSTLLDVLAGRGIEDIDAFLKDPSWNDLPDPMSIPFMEPAVGRVLKAIRERERIAIHGDYDCDGVLGAHVLRSVLRRLGAEPVVHLPHRDEGYGLAAPAVHKFSRSGTDLVITVDNGINARQAVELCRRLGFETVVIDHHRIQDRADTLAVWSPDFCGTGLAVLFAWALAARSGWKDSRIETMLEDLSQYAAIASVADCVRLLAGTRTLARLGLRHLGQARHCGVRELLRASCTDVNCPDSHDIAFGIAPRINAAGRLKHPSLALRVFEAAQNEAAAQETVGELSALNQERRQLVARQFDELVESIAIPIPAALVLYRESCPKGVLGLLASKCAERFLVPAIVLSPSATRGMAVGSGRSVHGFDLVEGLKHCERLLTRFGGHTQAAGLTIAIERIDAFRDEFTSFAESLRLPPKQPVTAEGELVLASLGTRFDHQLKALEPFGEGNRAPILKVRMIEVTSLRRRWARLRQGRYCVETRCWDLDLREGMFGDGLIELYGKRRILRAFNEHKSASPPAV